MAGSSSSEFSSSADAAKALGNERRLIILKTLCQVEPGLGSSKIAKKLGVAPPAADRHLKQLMKHTGLVRKFTPVRRDFETRPIWAVGNPQRARTVLALLENISRNIEVGLFWTKLETAAAKYFLRPYDRECEATLSRLLRHAPQHWAMFSDEERKKVEFWQRSTSRSGGGGQSAVATS